MNCFKRTNRNRNLENNDYKEIGENWVSFHAHLCISLVRIVVNARKAITLQVFFLKPTAILWEIETPLSLSSFFSFLRDKKAIFSYFKLYRSVLPKQIQTNAHRYI